MRSAPVRQGKRTVTISSSSRESLTRAYKHDWQGCSQQQGRNDDGHGANPKLSVARFPNNITIMHHQTCHTRLPASSSSSCKESCPRTRGYDPCQARDPCDDDKTRQIARLSRPDRTAASLGHLQKGKNAVHKIPRAFHTQPMNAKYFLFVRLPPAKPLLACCPRIQIKGPIPSLASNWSGSASCSEGKFSRSNRPQQS